MPCSMSQAHDQILALLKAALPPDLPVKYPDVAPPVVPFPPAAGNWARVTISDTDQGRPPPLVGVVGSRRYTSDGILMVQLFVLSGDGRRAAQTLGQTVLGAFRGQRTAGGVWFRRERVNDVGPEGPWWNSVAVVEYQYDSIQ